MTEIELASIVVKQPWPILKAFAYLNWQNEFSSEKYLI